MNRENIKKLLEQLIELANFDDDITVENIYFFLDESGVVLERISEDVDKIAMQLLCFAQDYKELQPGVIFKGEDYCSYELVIGYYCYKYRGKESVNFNFIERQYIKWTKNQWRDYLMQMRADRFDNRDY